MGLSPLKVMKINFKPKYLDIKNCKALLPKDEFNIVVQQVDKYLEEINNVDSDQVGLVDALIKQNKKSVGKPSRLILSQNIDVSRVRLRSDDWEDFSRMPRRLRHLRFTSQKIPPIIHLLPIRTNVMGLCSSKCHSS